MQRPVILRALAAVAIALSAPMHAAEPPEAFTRPEKGHCLACHRLGESAWSVTRPDIGPPLDGTRMRGLGRAKLRELLDDPMRANPDTVMPPYGRHRILEPREIEQIVEFLHALP